MNPYVTSFKKAINRKKLSLPMKYLNECNIFDGNEEFRKNRILDYGCGHGFDADSLGFSKYDPYYFPFTDWMKKKIITCNYVLNVLVNEQHIRAVLNHIQNLLSSDGEAYITVRDDKFKTGKTSKGYQWKITLLSKAEKSFKQVKIVKHKKGSFKMYKITKLTDISLIDIILE